MAERYNAHVQVSNACKISDSNSISESNSISDSNSISKRSVGSVYWSMVMEKKYDYVLSAIFSVF